MSTIAIVGGHGQIAQHLIARLVAAQHTPLALVRDPAQGPALERLGAHIRIVDIEKDESGHFAAAFEGADAVVFAAGGGPDGDKERKRTVDLGGSLKSIDGAKEAEIGRFVQVSAIGVDEALPDDTDDVWRAYVEAKRDADAALRDSGLDWTIIRPGGLTDDDGTGLVSLGTGLEKGQIPRDDVAAIIVAALETPSSIGKQWDAVGGDTPIDDAVLA